MKKILSLAASIISLFIIQLLILVNSNSEENNSKYYSNDNEDAENYIFPGTEF